MGTVRDTCPYLPVMAWRRPLEAVISQTPGARSPILGTWLRVPVLNDGLGLSSG